MNSSEEIGSAEETHDFEVQEGDRFGTVDPDCVHAEESVHGAGESYNEASQALVIEHVLKCDACGALRVVLTGEEIPV